MAATQNFFANTSLNDYSGYSANPNGPSYSSLASAAANLSATEANTANTLSQINLAGDAVGSDVYNTNNIATGPDNAELTDELLTRAMNEVSADIEETSQLMNDIMEQVSENIETISNNEQTISNNEAEITSNEATITADKQVPEQICVGTDEEGNPIYEHNPDYDTAQQEIAELTARNEELRAQNEELSAMNAALRRDNAELERMYHEYGKLREQKEGVANTLANISAAVSAAETDMNDRFEENEYNTQNGMTADEIRKRAYRTEDEYDESGNVTKKTYLDIAGNVLGTTTYDYDEDGNVRQEQTFDAENKALSYDFNGKDQNGNNIRVHSENTYDEFGNLATQNITTQSDTGSTATTINYDGNGQIVSESNYDTETGLTNYVEYSSEQDENGKPIIRRGETRNEKGIVVNSYERDDAGNANNKTYDDNGNMTSITSYDASTGKTNHSEYTTDESGNQVETRTAIADSDGNITYDIRRNDKGELIDCDISEQGVLPPDVEGQYYKDGAAVDVSNGNKHISYNQRGTYNEDGTRNADGWTQIRKDNQFSGLYDDLHKDWDNHATGWAPVVDSNGNIMIAPPRTIQSSACGTTSTASAIATMYGDTKTPDGEPITPDYLAEMLPGQNDNSGMNFLPTVCEHYGLDYDNGQANCGLNDTANNGELAMDNLLREGGAVIRSVNGGDHYIAITDIKEEDGKKYYFVVDTDEVSKTSGTWYQDVEDPRDDPNSMGRGLSWNDIKNGGGETGFIAPPQKEGDNRSIYDIMGIDPPTTEV